MRKCLNCSEPINGRSDRKFCNDYCRNSYNNKLRSGSNKQINQINRVLRKNRAILEKLHPGVQSNIHYHNMLQAGFNFNFMTNISTTKTGETCYFCYDYGYLPMDNDYYTLVKKSETGHEE